MSSLNDVRSIFLDQRKHLKIAYLGDNRDTRRQNNILTNKKIKEKYISPSKQEGERKNEIA